MLELRCSSNNLHHGNNILSGDNASEEIVLANGRDERLATSPSKEFTQSEWDIDKPHNGIQFDSHEAAYSFYQEYAKTMGFTTSIKNSRRSKKSKEFIDAKFACSRYGCTPESDMGIGRRPCLKKTDCKANMHVKRRPDGKWYIHEFVKEHNHELLPALAYHFQIHKNSKLTEKSSIDILHAVSERTRKMYVQMSRQFGGYQNIHNHFNSPDYDFNGRCYLSLEEGDAQILLEYFKHMQKGVPNFFYAVDLNDEQCLRNLFWVDAKGRKDYAIFNDVVSLDTSYLRGNDKMPLVFFVGVNHHFQPIPLGCALVAQESTSTFVWLMKTWLRAMGGQAPKTILTDQGHELKQAIQEVFQNTQHCFSLWHIYEKIHEILSFVVKRHENFMDELNKCIFKSWTDEDFDLKWWEIVGRFELQEDEWVKVLYDDREKWAPAYISGNFLAGMSTAQRSDSVNSFFDKYIHKKITIREFVKQYGTILQNSYEEEAIADFHTWHKQPALKSPSPWEKQMSTVYTHAIFKKFQVEVLGVVGCHFKKLGQDGAAITYEVEDCEKEENFIVMWDETKTEVCCLCHSFEYKGFLCRHALMVLQICGLTSIPSHYILKRWTKDANSQLSVVDGANQGKTRVQRYNFLCKQATGLAEEGSLSQESYMLASRTLADALKSCVDVNNRINTTSSCSAPVIRGGGDDGDLDVKTSKKKSSKKKRKAQLEMDVLIIEPPEDVQEIENVSSESMVLGSYYGAEQNVQGLLNLMEIPRDGYYLNQPNIRGLVNTIPTGRDNFLENEHSVLHGVGHVDFRTPSFSYELQGSRES